MRRATIEKVYVMPHDWTAHTRCPWCGERNQWTCQYDERPAMHYCVCPDCQAAYSLRITRRWVDVAREHRERPFTVIRESVAR